MAWAGLEGRIWVGQTFLFLWWKGILLKGIHQDFIMFVLMVHL